MGKDVPTNGLLGIGLEAAWKAEERFNTYVGNLYARGIDSNLAWCDAVYLMVAV